MKLSNRVNKIVISETYRIFSSLNNDIKVNMAVGEVELDTPREIIDSTIDALEKNKTKYSAISGLNELKDAIIKNMKPIDINQDNVLISSGSKQIIFSLIQILANEGDGVILPVPYWPSYLEQIKLAGAEPILVSTKNFQLDLEPIQDSIDKKGNNIKCIIINSPSNPSGAVYKEKDIKKLCSIAKKKGIWIILDETYTTFIYDRKNHINQKNFDGNVISVYSFSKSHSMSGFRLGYVIANKQLIHSLEKFQSHVLGNPCTFAQYGAIKALKTHVGLKKILQKRRDLAYSLVKDLFECKKPDGGLYLFPKVKNATSLCERLLMQGVAVVPGSAFGMKDHIRISFGIPENKIIEGFRIIKHTVEK